MTIDNNIYSINESLIPQKRIIIDTDSGIDDIISIIVSLKYDKSKLEAITVVGKKMIIIYNKEINNCFQKPNGVIDGIDIILKINCQNF